MFDFILIFGLAVFVAVGMSCVLCHAWHRQLQRDREQAPRTGGNRRSTETSRAAPGQSTFQDTKSWPNEIALQLSRRKKIECKLISRRFNDTMIDPLLTEAHSCPICLGEFEIGEEVSQSVNSDCLHQFHTECIIDWLIQRSRSPCPVCRREFLLQPAGP
jgi:hypothetical protein